MSLAVYVFMFFFFFQAEDGIRDKLVTGVQTCVFRSDATGTASSSAAAARIVSAAMRSWRFRWRLTSLKTGSIEVATRTTPDRESVVEGKRVDLGGRRMIKKKEEKREAHSSSGK